MASISTRHAVGASTALSVKRELGDDVDVYAVGIATAVNAPWQSANAVGVPKTGFPAETMARVAATISPTACCRHANTA
jgi:hypothetical protein